jgi:hypothetical protein
MFKVRHGFQRLHHKNLGRQLTHSPALSDLPHGARDLSRLGRRGSALQQLAG